MSAEMRKTRRLSAASNPYEPFSALAFTFSRPDL